MSALEHFSVLADIWSVYLLWCGQGRNVGDEAKLKQQRPAPTARLSTPSGPSHPNPPLSASQWLGPTDGSNKAVTGPVAAPPAPN